MDSRTALNLEGKLKGRKVGGYELVRLIDNGKSAAVFLAIKDSKQYAVKIFDDELIKNYGETAQFQRIKREINLKSTPHDNLIKIYEGGICDISNNHYLVMEFLDGDNLKQCLTDIKTEDIWGYVEQLALAAEHLEVLDLAHRDIKPENIMIQMDSKKLTLMDLGVLRPFGDSSLTDTGENLPFVGTLQYSSPEFLTRDEVDSKLGWRAVTFYQIGAVIHDLIMKYPIFNEDAEPYAKLVLAINNKRPEIINFDVDQELINLANQCLLKDPEKRVRLVNWSKFKPSIHIPTAKSKFKNYTSHKTGEVNDDNAKLEEIASNELEHKIMNFLRNSLRIFKSNEPEFPIFKSRRLTDHSIEIKYEINHLFECIQILDFEIVDALSESFILNSTVLFEGNELLSDVFYSGIYNYEKLFSIYEEQNYVAINTINETISRRKS